MAAFQTPVTRRLDAGGITYQVLPHGRPVYKVEEAAEARGIAPGLLVKTILLREKGGRYAVACVPGDSRLDPKAVRAALGEGWRRLQFASADEVLAETGYVQGAVAPVALASALPIVFDLSIGEKREVSISSGDPGAGLLVLTTDLLALTSARLAPITRAN